MKVLHIGGFYPEIGGPYSFIRNVGTATHKRGVETTILSPLPKRYPKGEGKPTPHGDLRVRYIETNSSSLLWPSYSDEWRPTIGAMLPSVDVVHVHGIFDHYAHVVSGQVRGKPYVLTVHGALLDRAITGKSPLRKGLYLKSIGALILKNASIIHLLNQEEKHGLEKACSLKGNDYAGKVRIIPPGIDLSEFSSLPPVNSFKRRFPELRNKRIILFLGRLHRIKGLDILVDAYERVAPRYDDVRLVLAGPENDGYGKKIRVRLEDSGLMGKVLFPGMLEGRDKLEAFVDAEIFVLPSYSEGSPMAVLEAMASGTPVVMSDRVGFRGEIERNRAATIVETNTESLAAGITALLHDGDERNRIAQNARRMAEDCYNIDTVADRMIEAYEDAIGHVR